MNSNVFIFHGTEGYPEENWFPWLKGELEAKDCTVCQRMTTHSKSQF